jgi:hypothetical protein
MTVPTSSGREPVATDYDLLAPVPTPEGVSAGPWRVEDDGRLVRTLSDGSIQRGNGSITAVSATQCRHCTVPVDSGDTCTFCMSYAPPQPEPTAPQRLDDAVNRIDRIRADVNAVIRGLPDASPMFAIVDVVNALGNLRNAAVLIDKATDTLEADAQAVL